MEITRNEKGEVFEAGKFVAKIPRDRTMSSVIGANPFEYDSVATFAEDGWIYVGGKRMKKWYGRVEGYTVWGPVLEDIPTLEERYRRIRGRAFAFHNDVYMPIYRELMEAGEAHVQPTHIHDDAERGWWYYSVRKPSNDDSYVTFDWVKKPAVVINEELGKRYYTADRKMQKYFGYSHRFETVLNRAIERFLWERKPDKVGVTLRLKINDRTYWYQSVYHGSSMNICWSKLAWPEDETIEIEI